MARFAFSPTPDTFVARRRQTLVFVLVAGALLLALDPAVRAQTAQTQRPEPQQNPAQQGAGRAGTASVSENGFRFTPFVVFSARYDDNIFVTASNVQTDTILSVRPGFAMRYLSPRTDFHFNYGLSADKYLRHSDLDSWDDEQGGSIGVNHWFTSRFNLGLDASYFETHHPQRLTPISGLIITRGKATRAAVNPSLVYAFSPNTNWNASYQYARDKLEGGPRTSIGTASTAITHQLGPRDSLQFEYNNVRYNFENGGITYSNLFTIGWSHALSHHTSIELGAGPRDTAGRVVPEILAGIHYQSDTADVSVAYRRTQRPVIGQAGVIDVQGLTASFAFVPARHLSFDISPSYFHDHGSDISADVWHLGFYMWYTFSPGWSIGLTESYVRQSGGFNTSGSVKRNVVGIALRWGLPSPAERYQGAELPVPGELRRP